MSFRCRRPTTTAHYQRGAVILIVLVAIVMGAAGLFVASMTRATARLENADQTALALSQARDALIGRAVSHANASTGPEVKPGMLPYPDRNGDGNYDGNSDCPSQNSAAVGNNLLLGKLPFIGEDNPCVRPRGLAIDVVDGSGERLWYAVSRNLVDDRVPVSSPNIPARLNGTSDWLTVRDSTGGILSDRAALILIAPGASTSTQNRSGAAPASSNFLDAYSVCTGSPCTPTTYRNWDNDLSFITAADTTLIPQGNNQFNDKVLYVTRDEFRLAIANRVAGEAKKQLKAYHDMQGSYPPPAPTTDGECVPSPPSPNGFIPRKDDNSDCSGAGIVTGLPPNWFPEWIPYVGYSRTGPSLVTLSIFGKDFPITP